MSEYIEKASNLIEIEERAIGRPKQFLETRLMNKSNRDIEDPVVFLKNYFKHFEVGFFADKRRSDWMIRQKRRIETAMF